MILNIILALLLAIVPATVAAIVGYFLGNRKFREEQAIIASKGALTALASWYARIMTPDKRERQQLLKEASSSEFKLMMMDAVLFIDDKTLKPFLDMYERFLQDDTPPPVTETGPLMKNFLESCRKMSYPNTSISGVDIMVLMGISDARQYFD